MNMEQPAPKTRSIELEISVDAPVATVWNSLIDPEQLANWFPREASGSSEQGGTLTFSWDEGCEWTTTIDLLEPNSHVRWVDPPVEGADPDATPAAVDFYVEARGGKTIVRLVHSGFSASSDWDEYYDATEAGWTYFLYNLQHYLERHSSTPRDMVWERRRTTKAREEIWQRLFGPDGFALDPTAERTSRGKRYRLRLGELSSQGVVATVKPRAHFAGTAEEWNNALLFVEFETGTQQWHCGLWLSTYGLPSDKVTTLQRQLGEVADRVFGEPTDVGS
jgi:uncharacterized protein YndB with AHSA1/START domain